MGRAALSRETGSRRASEGLTAVTEKVSKSKTLLARLVIVLLIAFVLVGLGLYGLSLEVLERIWHNMIGRTGGPMTFRFILQPVMATIAACLGGVKDARTGRTPFLWTVVNVPAKRAIRLNEAMIATARIILLGLIMDTIYQFIEFKQFHPAEAVIIALLLAFLPYVLVRGLTARVARRWVGGGSASEPR